jgi:nitrate/TMAO reductase-like tetraheme cytochrome c subunit
MLLVGLLAVTVVLLLVLAAKPSITRAPGGKILAFTALFLAPGFALLAGGGEHMERSKQTSFCLSCHVMEQYGTSLHVDDSEFIPAVHYQNNYVPRDKACYTCHTDDVMYGTIKAKLRGLRHVAVQYLGSVPDTIRLYTPYNNRECLHCHEGARKFSGAEAHRGEENFFADVSSGKRSCLELGCHDVAHNVQELTDATLWKEGQP